MKILITGLTLHNNKGGPALALSLIQYLCQKMNISTINMSVPNFDDNLKQEKIWAELYGIHHVVGAIGIKHILPPFCWNPKRTQERQAFENIVNQVDLIVDLNALSYMDLPHLTFTKNLVRNLNIYTPHYIAKQKNKPMVRWTQSYGPFRYWVSKQLIKSDLKNQKHIFARGQKSVRYLSELFAKERLYSFPDIAISLETKNDYLVSEKKYITLSPSSVLYTLETTTHLTLLRKLVEYLLDRDYEVILLPHNLMRAAATMEQCDLKVCEELNRGLAKPVKIIAHDLDVRVLKGIISNAYMHIGARYHSVIAALSSATPVISLAWHEKYEDIMRMYRVEHYVFNRGTDFSKLQNMVEEIETNHEYIVKNLETAHKELLQLLDKNINLFMENINAMQNL